MDDIQTAALRAPVFDEPKKLRLPHQSTPNENIPIDSTEQTGQYMLSNPIPEMENVQISTFAQRHVSPTDVNRGSKSVQYRLHNCQHPNDVGQIGLEQQQIQQPLFQSNIYNHPPQQPNNQNLIQSSNYNDNYIQQCNNYYHQALLPSTKSSVQQRIAIKATNNVDQYDPHQQHQQHKQHYDYTINNAASPFVAYDTQQLQQETAPAIADREVNTDIENSTLDYLQTIINYLNENPGQFDSIATQFLNIFEGMENNSFVLSIAMEDIFDKSITNPNFRYMGAKLYNLLHMLNPAQDSLFHTLLKCKLDYHQQEIDEFMQNNEHNKVRETALFLAELYMQLRGEEFRMHLIAEHITHLLKHLLSNENKDNVRCVCMTLKLAGFDLTSDCPNDMKDIIGQLEVLNSNFPDKYPLAASVLELQKKNWGRKLSNSESPKANATPNANSNINRNVDDPVFYGPDGTEISSEECEFLTYNANCVTGLEDDNEDNENNFDGVFDPAMGEDAQRAFHEFLKQKP